MNNLLKISIIGGVSFLMYYYLNYCKQNKVKLNDNIVIINETKDIKKDETKDIDIKLNIVNKYIDKFNLINYYNISNKLYNINLIDYYKKGGFNNINKGGFNNINKEGFNNINKGEYENINKKEYAIISKINNKKDKKIKKNDKWEILS